MSPAGSALVLGAKLLGAKWLTVLLIELIIVQANLPMVVLEGTPQPSPSRTVSALPLQTTPQDGGAGAAGDRRTSTMQGQNRPPRASGLGRFFSKMGVPGDSVAPEVGSILICSIMLLFLITAING